jgi:hypothetical protein
MRNTGWSLEIVHAQLYVMWPLTPDLGRNTPIRTHIVGSHRGIRISA